MRERCIVCGSPLYKTPLILCGSMPKSAQYFPRKEELELDKPVDLNLMQCSGCGLVQLNNEPVPYYQDVIRSGGYSTTMHQLRNEQYKRFINLCPIEGKKIIEVGCGQGEFLRIWREDRFPVQACGIEHDPRLVKGAQEDGLFVSCCFAEDEHIVFSGAPFDGFCSFNFLEHQPDPNGMLRCIYANLKSEAYGLLTVPAWEYIVEQESYYEIVRDHIAYYSRDSFSFLLEKNGFKVLSLQMVNRDTWEAIVAKKQPINLSSMGKNRDRLHEEIKLLIERVKNEKNKIAVWGASHQGLTILSSLGLNSDIAYVIDSAPFKQGRYTIGSHILIVPPAYIFENPVQTILIIAPGYTDEIAGLIRKSHGKQIEIYALRSNHLEILC